MAPREAVRAADRRQAGWAGVRSSCVAPERQDPVAGRAPGPAASVSQRGGLWLSRVSCRHQCPCGPFCSHQTGSSLRPPPSAQFRHASSCGNV